MAQGSGELFLCILPAIVLGEFPFAGQQPIECRHGVVIFSVPLIQTLEPGVIAALLAQEGVDLVELIAWNLFRQRPPAVALAQQCDEVGRLGCAAAAIDLAQTNSNRMLIFGGFLTYAPTQIHRLERGIMGVTELLQAGKHSLAQRIALSLQVTERGADE